jgi:hypothetical protein
MPRINFSIPWPYTGAEMREVLSFTFQTALVTYLCLYLAESIWPGFVTKFNKLDTFLWLAIITGVISTIWPAIVTEVKKEKTKLKWPDCIWIGVLTLGTVAIVWYKTAPVGWLVKVIAPLSGLIVLGLSLVVYYDRDESDVEK